MCGIFCYCQCGVSRSYKDLLNILLQGLKRLEYRGYDSAGIQIFHDSCVRVVRKVGNVDALIKEVFESALTDESMLQQRVINHVGLAHTRWATHGEPCDRNAHPHTSKDNEFVVVHNGVMTNYDSMRTYLQGKGYTFKSDTDTEVIANLAHYVYHNHEGPLTFSQLLMEVTDLAEGAFALVFTSSKFPGEVAAGRRGSPLILGVRGMTDGVQLPSQNEPWELFISSDSTSIVEHTRKVIYLEDDDIVHFAGGILSIVNKRRYVPYQQARQELREIRELEIALDSITKGTYDHFMLKEIFEQPRSITDTLRGRVGAAGRDVLISGIKSNSHNIQSANRIIFIACGTSLHSCIAVRPLFDELVTVSTSVENASDFLDRSPNISRADVCVFVSQSGETADTLRALEYCKERGALLVGVTNVVGSGISRLTDCGAHLNAGAEVGVASTKAYTSQIAVLVMMALALSEDRVSVRPRREKIVAALLQLPQLLTDCLNGVNAQVKAIAASLVHAKSVLFLGRGYQLATALEAALKVSELAYIHSQGLNAGELKHGPLALIEPDLPLIVLSPKDGLEARTKAAVSQICARGGRPLVVTTEIDDEIAHLGCAMLQVPLTVDCLQPIVNIIPLQLLAYHLAVLRGNNVDCPRNLAKSVTVQ